MFRLPIALLMLFLLGCEPQTTLAPVVEGKWRAHTQHSSKHIVRRGETLYAVAFRYDIDYRQLAAFNRLQSPYTLKVGQVLRIGSKGYERNTYAPIRPASKQPQSLKRTTIKKEIPSARRNRMQYSSPSRNWVWPVYKGRIASGFLPLQGKKGIDIAGKKGEKIRAASSGVVAYAGNGLSGYGNLIIIKHNNQFLTAYGNNLRNLVKEGQKVKAGQIIAEMGVIDRRFWGVHFEIRMAGRPVNPLNYLRS
jgi:lipoprotein NlpD